jgi:hypothetical protein
MFVVYLTVILRTRVEYELIADEARRIGYRLYSTRVSGITVLLYTQGLNSTVAHTGQPFSVETCTFSVQMCCYSMEIKLLRGILPLFCHGKPFLRRNMQFLRGNTQLFYGNTAASPRKRVAFM